MKRQPVHGFQITWPWLPTSRKAVVRAFRDHEHVQEALSSTRHNVTPKPTQENEEWCDRPRPAVTQELRYKRSCDRKNDLFASPISWTLFGGYFGPRRNVTNRFVLVLNFWATARAASNAMFLGFYRSTSKRRQDMFADTLVLERSLRRWEAAAGSEAEEELAAPADDELGVVDTGRDAGRRDMTRSVCNARFLGQRVRSISAVGRVLPTRGTCS